MRDIGVVLLGCGGVGRAVLRRLAALDGHVANRYGLRFAVQAVCDSRGAAVFDAPSTPDVQRLSDWLGGGKPLGQFAQYRAQWAPTPAKRSILVDCTATDAVSPMMIEWLQQGAGVVMANKKPLTGPMADFDAMTGPAANARCRYESTAGAGTPFVATVSRIVAANDTIKSIEGTFSGTLGYLCAHLQDGGRLSELVVQAHSGGLTEPDPRDDLSGMDVARKALILARTMGWRLEMSDIDIEPLYPASLADVPLADFFSGLHIMDDEITGRIEAAAANDAVLRYAAKIADGKIRVGLLAVPKSSMLGRLKGTDNAMVVHSDIYSENPLIVQGSGAGGDITASGIVADMVDVARSLQ